VTRPGVRVSTDTVGVFDVLWIFFLLSAVQPMIRQRMVDRTRGNLPREIERQRKSRVITFVHRQETERLLQPQPAARP